MNDRVYVLLDVIEGKAKEVARTLAGKSGVVSADVLENPVGVIMVVEASGQKQLAALTVRAITSVDNLTNGLRLLPVKSNVELATVAVNTGPPIEQHAHSGRKEAMKR